MINFLKIIILVCWLCKADGLKCYSCTDADFNGESNDFGDCFKLTGTTSSVTCPTAAGYYCRTSFTLQDGITTSVQRQCILPSADEDLTGSNIPTSNKCQTRLSSSANPTDTTTCYYHCDTDNCNSIEPSQLISCMGTCSEDTGQGYCDYIIGKCSCQPNFSGENCQTAGATPAPLTLRCVQCNSDTDSGCDSENVADGSICPGGEEHCSVAKTTIYDDSDKVIRSIVTRGCTDRFEAVDECAFTDIYNDNGITSSGYSEYTCYSTCDTDNCNKNIPDGLIDDNEKPRLFCAQCTDTDPNCATTSSRKACPSTSTHCKATVVYTISNKADLSYSAAPVYKLVSLARECTTASVTTACTEKTVGDLSFKKVTCTETCQEDGCNIGWPVRPKCLQCSSSPGDILDGYDTCLQNPPAATQCDYPYHRYCVLIDSGLKEGKVESMEGYTRRIQRACSHYDIGHGCSQTTPRETAIQSCNFTCTTDGCNTGSGAGRAVAASGVFSFTTILLFMLR